VLERDILDQMDHSSEKLSIPRDLGEKKYPKVTGKGTAHHRTGHDGPEGE
jgi:hypothetical protein